MFNIALIIVLILLGILAFYKGRGVLFCIISSFYPSIILYQLFPYKKNFIFFTSTKDQLFISHALIFLVFFLLSYFIMNRTTHASSLIRGVSGLIDALLLSVSITALTVVLCLHVLPTRDIFNLSGSVERFFISDLGYFLSLLVPMAVVYHLSKKTYY